LKKSRAVWGGTEENPCRPEAVNVDIAPSTRHATPTRKTDDTKIVANGRMAVAKIEGSELEVVEGVQGMEGVCAEEVNDKMERAR